MSTQTAIDRAIAQIEAETQLMRAADIARQVSRRTGNHDTADLMDAELATNAAAALQRVARALQPNGGQPPDPALTISDAESQLRQAKATATATGLTLRISDDSSFQLLDELGNSHYD